MSTQISADREDYERFLVEYGFTQQFLDPIVQSTADQVPMPEGFNKLALQPSPIHGLGMFATCAVEEGELLAPARVDGKRTPAGRYTNHSVEPNAVFVALDSGDLNMVAARAIQAGEEVTIDYRQAGRVNSRSMAVLRLLAANPGGTMQ